VGNFRPSTVIDAEKIEAKMKSGVLELRLPKAAEAPLFSPLEAGYQE
jgi:HSP20 family molecular chaperone IbpA